MGELKKNKTAQFIAGCLTLLIFWEMHKRGIFNMVLSTPPEGYESGTLLAMALGAIVSALQLVGLIALHFVGFLYLQVHDLAVVLFDKAKQFKLPALPRAQGESVVARINAEELSKALVDLNSRLERLEEEWNGY